MFRLLINSPNGMQQVVPISETGSYFDPSRVLWDERIDGALPEITLGRMQRSGNELITLAEDLPEHAAAVRAASIPHVITIRQCERALIQAGLFAQVNTFINSQSDDIQAYWRRSTEVRRDHAVVAMVQAELGKTDSEMDDLFILAGTLE